MVPYVTQIYELARYGTNARITIVLMSCDRTSGFWLQSQLGKRLCLIAYNNS